MSLTPHLPPLRTETGRRSDSVNAAFSLLFRLESRLDAAKARVWTHYLRHPSSGLTLEASRHAVDSFPPTPLPASNKASRIPRVSSADRLHRLQHSSAASNGVKPGVDSSSTASVAASAERPGGIPRVSSRERLHRLGMADPSTSGADVAGASSAATTSASVRSTGAGNTATAASSRPTSGPARHEGRPKGRLGRPALERVTSYGSGWDSSVDPLSSSSVNSTMHRPKSSPGSIGHASLSSTDGGGEATSGSAGAAGGFATGTSAGSSAGSGGGGGGAPGSDTRNGGSGGGGKRGGWKHQVDSSRCYVSEDGSNVFIANLCATNMILRFNCFAAADAIAADSKDETEPLRHKAAQHEFFQRRLLHGTNSPHAACWAHTHTLVDTSHL